jgi:hypothetical protein
MSLASNRISPEEIRTDGKTAIDRVEEITDLRILPHEWPLDVRQAEIADVDVSEQLFELAVERVEQCSLVWCGLSCHREGREILLVPCGFTKSLALASFLH